LVDSNVNLKTVDWKGLGLWMLATGLGSITGLYAAYVTLLLAAPFGELIWLIFGLVLGFFIGAAQSLVLSRWVDRPLGWIVATAVVEGLFWWTLLITTVLGLITVVILSGLLLAVFQWPFLRFRLARAVWWILFATAGRALGGLLAFYVVHEASELGPGVATVLALYVAGALVTGMALSFYFKNTPRFSPSDVSPRPLGL